MTNLKAIKAAALVASVVFASGIAQAGDADQSCLFSSDQSSCDLLSSANGVRIVVGEGNTAALKILSVRAGTNAITMSDLGSVDVAADLEAGVLDQSMDPSDADTIMADLLERPDFSYVVPQTISILKNELGFAQEMEVKPVDLLELVRVHIQLALGTTPTTSAYIAHKLGLELAPGAQVEEIPENVEVQASAAESVEPQTAAPEVNADPAMSAEPTP